MALLREEEEEEEEGGRIIKVSIGLNNSALAEITGDAVGTCRYYYHLLSH